jgi:hypothetical protein
MHSFGGEFWYDQQLASIASPSHVADKKARWQLNGYSRLLAIHEVNLRFLTIPAPNRGGFSA